MSGSIRIVGSSRALEEDHDAPLLVGPADIGDHPGTGRIEREPGHIDPAVAVLRHVVHRHPGTDHGRILGPDVHRDDWGLLGCRHPLLLAHPGL